MQEVAFAVQGSNMEQVTFEEVVATGFKDDFWICGAVGVRKDVGDHYKQ